MEPIFALVLVVTGVAAGFASGMLGVGGGFIMVPVQIWVLTSLGVEPTMAIRISFGTALAVALPTAVNGAFGHHRRGAVVPRASLFLGVAGFAGAFFGGAVAAVAPGEVLRVAFGLVVIAAAVRMATAPDPRSGGGDEVEGGGRLDGDDVVDGADGGYGGGGGGALSRSDGVYLLLGLPIGFISGLVGIGGGLMMVPVLAMAMGFGIHRAVGTSTAAIILTSSGGVLSYVYHGLAVPGLPPFSLGYVNLLQAALLAGTSIPMAWAGVRAAHRLPADRLRGVFSLVMVYIGLEMMGAFEIFRLLIR
ncbi:sulfite exporter TauE/SafE family protein [Candidatus Methanocrinis natronophilus]|uniref:Probable membrane transporter protein n=1 Tax=Candidatus Methanocrinis natronophilus TaxID=3033396 RepID=A0ABT5X7N6_9EURY|nr:sulfite exporter TauE/SafE family protein [Candidatus Methanocrinis natronophilus]MDF0590706.1 sulfite exporter TauE/SafE family protein [Candidatus Methanocrinis natronophilus]